STTRSDSAGTTSRSPSPMPDRRSSSLAPPSGPAEQNEPSPPEGIDVTVLDNRNPVTPPRPDPHRLRRHPPPPPAPPPPDAPPPAPQARPARMSAAPSAAPPPPAAPAAPAPAAAAPEAGPGRDPQARLEALFDPGSTTLLLPPDDSGILIGEGRIDGLPAVA